MYPLGFLTKKQRKLLTACTILIAIVVVILIINSKSEPNKYIIVEAQKGSITQAVIATGEVSASILVNVGAQVSGQIIELDAYIGKIVKKGDLLAEIDSQTQKNDLMIQKSHLNSYIAQLNSKKISLRIATAQYNRAKKLISADATSKENLENAENTLALAHAEVNELEALVAQTRISLSTAETNISYTKILSPLDGVIVSVPVEKGQTVNANQTTPTILQIADLSQMAIKIQISEADVTKLKPGMKVDYSILSDPSQIHTTVLNSIDPGPISLSDGQYSSTSEKNSAIYYYGKLLVDNKNDFLRIGMTTLNTIIVNSVHNVIIIPKTALNDNDEQYSVLVLTDSGIRVSKNITIGLEDDFNVQVVSGLQIGDKIISGQVSQ